MRQRTAQNEKQNNREKQSLKTIKNKYIKIKKLMRMQVLVPYACIYFLLR